jgi:hypothetical protein
MVASARVLVNFWVRHCHPRTQAPHHHYIQPVQSTYTGVRTVHLDRMLLGHTHATTRISDQLARKHLPHY